MSKKRPLDSNAEKALNEMKLEIAQELGITNDGTEIKNDLRVYQQVKTGGNMTKRLVEMGQNQLINRK